MNPQSIALAIAILIAAVALAILTGCNNLTPEQTRQLEHAAISAATDAKQTLNTHQPINSEKLLSE